MDPPFIRTKLFVPPASPTLVQRPRLIERLARNPLPPLTLISAPAGAGKTTLLREWIDAQQLPVAWLSVDGSDNDPTRFWASVIAAIKTRWHNFGESSLTSLRSPRPVPIQSVLTMLVNEITAAADRLILVLDDYHVIKAPSIHEALAFFLDHLAPQMRIVISTRVDPLLPLGRLRARAQLTELRDVDLRFTPQEASIFLNQVMGLELAVMDVAALEARTEGWIAGLQLVALSLQREDAADRARFIAAFTGSDRYILDYLVAEILDRQADQVQQFLLDTSILDRLTGSLCDTLTGAANGQASLEALEQANMFLIPLDNRREWYRYHRLFGDILRHQLDRTQPGRASELHRRAAKWYEEHGFRDSAIEHILAAADYENAARLLRKHASSMLLVYGEPHTLLRWLSAVPASVFDAHPAFRLARAWAYVGTSQLEAVDEQLIAIEAGEDYHCESNVALWGEIALLRATIAVLRGDIHLIFEYAQRAADCIPENDTIGHSFAAWILGQSQRFRGKAIDAERAFLRAADLARAAGSHFVDIMASCNRADRLIEQGKLHEGFELHRQLQARTIQGQHRPVFIIGNSLIWAGGVLREWNDLENAASDIERGIDIVQGILAEAVVLGCIALSRVRLAQHDLRAAIDACDQGLINAQRHGVPYLWLRAQAWQARLYLAQGKTSLAIKWATDSGLQPGDPITYRDEETYLGLARVLIAQGRVSRDRAAFQQAYQLAVRIRQSAEDDKRSGRVIEALIVQSLAVAGQRRPDEALTSLMLALSLAEPEGYVRIFVDEGTPMASLLRRVNAQGIAHDYADRLLAALAQPAPRAAVADYPSPLESLSEREIEVLRMIAENRSNQEIAAALYVSINTVKTHIKRTYQKLNVRNRFEAVDFARKLKIL